MDDNKIIELFFARSEQAIIELSNKYGSICRKVADNVLHDRLDVEECLNDAYLGVWNSIPPQKPNPLLSYVCRIVRNLALKKYYENTAQKRNSFYDIALDEFEDCIPSSLSVEDEIEAKEVAVLINDFLETLDKPSRVMFFRRYWHADSIEDLANLFHSSKHYISVRLSRIRKSLRHYLEEKGVSI
jgi:RNA polymerase sigma-70 factor (ECF subfamily)